MKNIIPSLSLLFLALLFGSCSKNGIEANALIGRWNIVNDSSALLNLPGHNYYGTAKDYFEFTTDGILYTKEGDYLDTANYTLANDTLNVVQLYGKPPIQTAMSSGYIVTNLTAHSATFTFFGGWGPARHEIINLSR